MELERADHQTPSEFLIEQRFDAIFAVMSEKARPFENPAIEALDWKTGGTLTSLRLKQQLDPVNDTVLATMSRVPTPYIIVQRADALDLKRFIKNCEGMKLKTVLFVAEGGLTLDQAEKKLRGEKVAYPEKIVFGPFTQS